MKGSGTFRGWIAIAFGFLSHFKWWGGKKYDDPHLQDPYHHPRSHAGSTSNRVGRRRLNPPPCHPGTVTYRDRLVRHLGYDRRKADRMLKAWRETGAELPEL